MPRDRRYSTARWRRLRQKVIARDGRICSVPDCRSDMTLKGMVHIDHIVEVRDGGAFWSPDNCRVVCRYHHFEKSVGTIAARASGAIRDAYGRPFPADGHWVVTPSGREWQSPNYGACDNPRCRLCISRGDR